MLGRILSKLYCPVEACDWIIGVPFRDVGSINCLKHNGHIVCVHNRIIWPVVKKCLRIVSASVRKEGAIVFTIYSLCHLQPSSTVRKNFWSVVVFSLYHYFFHSFFILYFTFLLFKHHHKHHYKILDLTIVLKGILKFPPLNRLNLPCESIQCILSNHQF